jgi:hypothetical protein
MYSSQNFNNDLIFSIYSDSKTVYRLNDIAMLVEETDSQSLNKRLNYFVRTGKLQNPRKGIYAKSGYNKDELACNIFIPSYISLEYVLQKAGIVFQYNSQITSVSYLKRSIEIEGFSYLFRKIKGEILVDTRGIIQNDNHVNIALPERAFLDVLYLDGDYYFDNLNSLTKDLIYKLLPIYQSKILTQRVSKLLYND